MLRKYQKPWMPETEKDPRCKGSLPGGLSGDNVIHEFEQPVGVVLNFDVYIKLDVLVFRLRKGRG